MSRKQRPILLAVLLILLGCSASPHPASSARTIDYCVLPNHPGEWVRIKANYRVGFEWSELGDPKGCLPSSIWIDFGGSSPDPLGVFHSNQIEQYYGSEMEIIAVGRLEDGGSYGHEGFYPLQFVVERLERVLPLTPQPIRQELRYRR